MPRGARLDAPGCLHHAVVRGIERRAIFLDDDDRTDLLDRLAALVEKTHVEADSPDKLEWLTERPLSDRG